jgi:hypothetical protein
MGKRIVVLARRDPGEAMRVAAGLTIFGHEIRLVFMQPVEESPQLAAMTELLELAGIVPETALQAMAGELRYLDGAALGAAVAAAAAVVSV